MFGVIGIFIVSLFYANIAFGYITENDPGCSPTYFSSGIFAYFTPNQHTCGSNEYMPANYDGCVACPTGQTCVSGTYTFNENLTQGVALPIRANIMNGCGTAMIGNNPHAIFTPNIHTCTPGYYMPANNDGCVICPADNYCSGGTYTFNETTAQGIEPCPAGLVAPTGMWEIEQCGRTLRVGTNTVYLRRTQKTNPSLCFDVNGDGSADFFANTTTLDRVMSRDSLQKLKIKVGDTVYSVHDDTME